ncbi:AtpZ/AtpI family protein [Flavobacteriales bacterium]|nr:AtpZ/AtpI family protein [Flavobacteriales bacterium]
MTKKNENSEIKKVNSFAKFSSAGIQMGVLIVAGVYFGEWLDKKFEFESPWMTIVFALLGVFIGLYIVIREVIKMSK